MSLSGQASLKVKGGKLLHVQVFFDGEVHRVEITGDFFMHPEEGLVDLENALIGVAIDESENSITDRIRRVVIAKKIEMIGISPDAVGAAVKHAISSCED